MPETTVQMLLMDGKSDHYDDSADALRSTSYKGTVLKGLPPERIAAILAEENGFPYRVVDATGIVIFSTATDIDSDDATLDRELRAATTF